MARLAVTKCQGAGNDFVLLDRTLRSSLDYPPLARALCDRRFGVGADGLLVLEDPARDGCDVALRIFNADGSQAEMCGNGIRCAARYLHERRPGAPRALRFETLSGEVPAQVIDSGARFAVRVEMGVPRAGAARADEVAGCRGMFSDVDMGNPHVVGIVDADLASLDLRAFADEIVARRGDVNVEAACVQDDGAIAMRVRERGVGETLACGTGACAVAVAAIAMNRAASPARVRMPGGEVVVEWPAAGQPAVLTGPAEIVFDTVVDDASSS